MDDALDLPTLLNAKFYLYVSDSLSLVLLTMQVHQHQGEQKSAVSLDKPGTVHVL